MFSWWSLLILLLAQGSASAELRSPHSGVGGRAAFVVWAVYDTDRLESPVSPAAPAVAEDDVPSRSLWMVDRTDDPDERGACLEGSVSPRDGPAQA